MNFLIPLGLLGLISIPVLILIYILRPNYHPQSVSSTFIWKLSQKYMKKQHHTQWIKNSLLFILQILVLLSVSLMLTKPYFAAAKLSGEKIIILDTSASMQAEKNGMTRFERAVRDIRLKTLNTNEKNKVSIIAAGEKAYFVLRRCTSADEVSKALDSFFCTYNTADINTATELAKTVLDENPNADVYLYTDRDYEQSGFIAVKNMYDDEANAAVTETSAKLRSGYYVFTADIANYGKDASLLVSLTVDGVTKLTKSVSVKRGETAQVSFWDEPEVKVNKFASARVSIDTEDSFIYDNSYVIYGQSRPRYIELVSEYPHLLQMVLLSDSRNSVYQATLLPEPKIYTTGYDMYVYEGMLPSALPSDGALLLVNPPSSCFGVEITGEKSGEFTAQFGSESKNASKLISGIETGSIDLTKYSVVNSYDDRYEAILTCEGYPILLVGKTDGGIPIIILTFDLHYSTLPLLMEFPVLIRNLCEYGAPPVSDTFNFTVGQTATLNGKPNASSLTLNYTGIGNAEPKTWNFNDRATNFTFEAPGTYAVIQHLSDNKIRTDNLFVSTDSAESDFLARGGVLAEESYGDGQNVNFQTDAVSQIFMILAMCLLVLMAAEWGVQSHERF